MPRRNKKHYTHLESHSDMNSTYRQIDHSRPIAIYESDLRTIAGMSAENRELETGGDLFGYYDRGGNLVLSLVLGPGPQAIFEPAHFAQNADFTLKANMILANLYGMSMGGTWHCHHNMGLPQPSDGDDRTVMSLAGKNDLRRWVMIIITHEYTGETELTDVRLSETEEHAMSRLRVRINAFTYTDPENGKKVRVPIRVLPGDSPFRRGLLSSDDLELTSLCKWAPWFPMEKILYDKYEPQHTSTDVTAEFPTVIIEQIQQLPGKTQRDVTLSVQEEFITVSFSITKQHTVTVSYSTQPPHNISDVELVVNNLRLSVMNCFTETAHSLNRIHRVLRLSSIRLARERRKVKARK